MRDCQALADKSLSEGDAQLEGLANRKLLLVNLMWLTMKWTLLRLGLKKERRESLKMAKQKSLMETEEVQKSPGLDQRSQRSERGGKVTRWDRKLEHRHQQEEQHQVQQQLEQGRKKLNQRKRGKPRVEKRAERRFRQYERGEKEAKKREDRDREWGRWSREEGPGRWRRGAGRRRLGRIPRRSWGRASSRFAEALRKPRT